MAAADGMAVRILLQLKNQESAEAITYLLARVRHNAVLWDHHSAVIQGPTGSGPLL